MDEITVINSTTLNEKGYYWDEVWSLAVDSNNNIIVGGRIWDGYKFSQNIGYVSKIKSTSEIDWMFFFNIKETTVKSVIVDSNDNIIVAGYTTSVDFPTTPGAFNETLSGDRDIFLTKLDSSGSILWSTYFGGTASEWGGLQKILIDHQDNIIICGGTPSADFPTLNAEYSLLAGDEDIILAKFSPLGSLLWITYLGGSFTDIGVSVAINKLNGIYIAGITQSPDFPVKSHISSYDDNQDLFLAHFNSSGKLIWSRFVSGMDWEDGGEIDIDD